MMLPNLNLFSGAWEQTLKIATSFWGVCLLLVLIESTVGDNTVTRTIFFLSVPVLVGYLLWANVHLLMQLRKNVLSVMVLGVYVLCSASAIVFVGLFAAANLKTLMTGV